MPNAGNHSDFSLHQAFESVQNLAWHPWVGQNYLARPTTQRLLVVGESHYDSATNAQGEIEATSGANHRDWTQSIIRDFVYNAPPKKNDFMGNTSQAIYGSWSTSLVKDFWYQVAFYNFVQRPMCSKGKANSENPTRKDFTDGWPVFAALLPILQPSYVLFMGSGMFQLKRDLPMESITIHKHLKVGRPWARKGTFSYGEEVVPFASIRHPSSFFSHSSWYKYLVAHHADLLACVQ